MNAVLNNISVLLFVVSAVAAADRVPCPVVDTGQVECYDVSRSIPYPNRSQAFYGQDAQYVGYVARYHDHGDGTVRDLVTGLTWSKAVDPVKVSLEEATAIAADMDLGGHKDWRVPNIKELYSLIDFRGCMGVESIPFINTDVFDFRYGDTDAGERMIDGQWLSCTKYVSTTMGGSETLFGVNFADGRIKGYGYRRPGRRSGEKKFYARYVRGEAYGHNDFVDNGDGTVTDRATGLMWMQMDSAEGMTWEQALDYAESLVHAGYNDWRLPNAKELQYIVDYTRSPDTSDSPAIDPVFSTSAIVNEAGDRDYPHFWTSTTHLDGPVPAANAAYIAFGRALGQMQGVVMDVHGAGAQRSDPKVGAAALGHGPQGDARRVYNYVRCVRGGGVSRRSSAPKTDRTQYPANAVVDGSGAMEGQGGGPGMRGPGPERGPGGFVERLDRDGDGKVSRAEFDGPSQRFDRIDRNRDGFLAEDEAPAGPPPPRGPGRP